jgi:hypothetical protein
VASDVEVLLMSQVAQAQANGPVCYSVTTVTSTTANVALAIPPGYNNADIVWRARASDAVTSEQMHLHFNGDNGNNYTWQYIRASTSTVTGGNSAGATSYVYLGDVPGASATSGYFASGRSVMTGLQDTTDAGVITTTFMPTSSSAAEIGTYGSLWNSGTPVTTVLIACVSGSFVASSRFSLFVYN